VKRWRNAAIALRWTAAGMLEATKGFGRLKARKYLPVLRAASAVHQSRYVTQRVDRNADAALYLPRRRLLRLFQQNPGIPGAEQASSVIIATRRRAARNGVALPPVIVTAK
jgi:hypothetical protein